MGQTGQGTSSVVRADTIPPARLDTLPRPEYINEGKIAARKAAIRSAILPGLGQLGNKVNVWSIGKVGLIYGGFTALTLSYIDNTRLYKVFLKELQYRAANGAPDPTSVYASYPTQSLFVAKDVYRRNREVIIFSYVGVYAINIIDAYVAASLKYFNVNQDIAMQVAPSMIINQGAFGTLASAPVVPSIKLTFRL